MMSDAVVLSRVSGAAVDGRLQYVRVRQRLFRSFHAALIKHHDALLEATQADDGCTKAEAQAVFASALIELRNHYNLLDFEKDLDLEYSLSQGKSNEGRRTPIALTYVIPNSLNLLYNVVSVLGAALEAGSCVVIELESTVQRTPRLVRQVIAQSLDQQAFGVVSSRAPAEFLTHCVVVDQKPGMNDDVQAQRVLRSPEYRNIAVVDRTGDTSLAAREIVASRSMFGGASSYAVDLILVNEYVEEEFREVLGRALAETGSTELLVDDRSKPRRRGDLMKDTEDTLVDREVKAGRAVFVRGDSSKGVLLATDRSCQVACRKFSGSRLIIYITITSLDDAIDLLTTEAQRTVPIGALYLFAQGREGKYLSQYIESRGTYLNHIPAQLSGKTALDPIHTTKTLSSTKELSSSDAVGPMVPKDYSTKLSERYIREMFELPSPEAVVGPKSHLISHLHGKADSFDQVARRPLKPTGQSVSGAWGFFEQGIILGAMVYILPLMGMVTFGVGYAGWTGFTTWRALR